LATDPLSKGGLRVVFDHQVDRFGDLVPGAAAIWPSNAAPDGVMAGHPAPFAKTDSGTPMLHSRSRFSRQHCPSTHRNKERI
jgi:hypothetical protein